MSRLSSESLPEPAGDAVDAFKLSFEHLRCGDNAAGIGDNLGDAAQGSGPIDVLAVGGCDGRGHHVDPLITRGGVEAAWGGVDGGVMALEEFVEPVPWAPLPAGTVAVVAPELEAAPLPAGTVAVVAPELEAVECPGKALAT